MERKLKPTKGLLEIGIEFNKPTEALRVLESLVNSAITELTDDNDNEGQWPTNIYWDNKELHFQLDNYVWDSATYIQELLYHSPKLNLTRGSIIEYHQWD